MMQGLRKKYLGDRAFYKMALMVAVPIMVQNGITNFVSLLDNIMVGAVGTVEMAGVSIANTLMFVLNLAIFGAVSGTGIYGAQFYGSNDMDGVRYTFRFKLMICSAVGVLDVLLFAFFGSDLIRLYLRGQGDAEDIASSLRYGRQYLNIMMLGVPAMIAVQCYSGTLRETGQTVLPMRAGLAAVGVNLCLNWVLIFGKLGVPALGSNGAAVATVVSRYVEAAIVALWTHRHWQKNSYICGVYRSFRVPKKLAKKIFICALPLILNETLWALSVALLKQCYSVRGFDVVPAVNIASTVSEVCNVAFLAMGNAIGIIIGQQLGAGEVERAKDTDRKLIVFSVLICLLFGSILAAISGIFPKLFNATDAVRNLSTKFILVSAAIMPVCAYSNACYFTLRSGGKTMVTVLFDSVYACLIVTPVAFVLSRYTTLPVVPLYICTQAMELGKCIVGTFMLRSGIWIQNIVRDACGNEPKCT